MSWSEKTVLITGGTGSFGRQLTSLLMADYRPKRIIIFSRDEMKQFAMRAEGFDAANIRYFIGDVRDKERLYRAFYDVDIVIHAAAMKQVPCAEYNPFEAIKTNVMGAANVIDAAIDCGVQHVIALSTDKAALPVNLYGASKLCSDKLFVAGNVYAGARKTRMSVVRYGNVAGSRGSVIPYFWEQKKTGRLTITDKRMTRFLITLEQGARFVMSCLEQMHGGEIFVPKIPSVQIRDLAEVIAPECSIEFVGIRPGEKLHEVMIPRDDARHTVELEDFFVIQPDFRWWDAANWSSGEPCVDSFEYASNTNSHWLGRDEIALLLAQLGFKSRSENQQPHEPAFLRAVAAAR